MIRAALSVVILSVFLTQYASGKVCTQSYAVTTYESKASYYTCGWWGWGSCARYTSVPKILQKTRQICCPGSYGSVDTDCEGVCPYQSALRSSACPNSRICRDYQCDKSGVRTSSLPAPTALTFNENDDQEKLLWTVVATCFVQESCPCARKRRDIETEEREKRATCTCSKTVPCTHCAVQSTNGIAEVRNGVEIYRKKCSNTACSDCSKYPGCLDHLVNNTITVECRASGYIDNGVVQQSLTLTVQKADEPTIELPPEADEPMTLDTDAEVGDVIMTLGEIDTPASEGEVTYSLKEGPVSTITGEPLFGYNETTNEIYVYSDLSQEPGGVYTFQFCVGLRRGDSCVALTVELERITTTTTTTEPTTTEPEDEYMCVAASFWKELPGMDLWCDLTCTPIPTTCPYLHTHCTCKSVNTERLSCTAGGFYETNQKWKKHMDVWCDMNCNAGIYSNCPTNTTLGAYCVCN